MLDNYTTYFFDLDNTLYDEFSFLFPVYVEISNYLESKFNINKKKILNSIFKYYLYNGSYKIYSHLISKFKLPEYILNDLVLIQRNYISPQKIPLYINSYLLLEKLIREEKKIFIITNGNIQQQKNKVASIEWLGYEKTINFIFADEIEKKPEVKLFKYIIDKYNLDSHNILMIGNSINDLLFAINCAIDFINVKLLFNYENSYSLSSY